jgi:hypothetical protein
VVGAPLQSLGSKQKQQRTDGHERTEENDEHGTQLPRLVRLIQV